MLRIIIKSLLLLTLLPQFAHSDECTWTEGKASRLRRIQQVLDTQRRKTTTWRVAWTGTFGAAMVGQAALATASDSAISKVGQTREGLWIGSTKALLGVGSMTVTPVLISNETFPATCEGLSDARDALRDGARLQRRGRGWFKHVGGTAVGVGGLLIQGFGYDQWRKGTTAALIGFAVGQASIWTQPTGAIDAAEKLDDGNLSWGLRPMLPHEGVGLTLWITH